MKTAKYTVSFEDYRPRKLLVQLTASLMKNNKGWKKDTKLSCLEFDIEDAITKTLENRGIKVIK